MGSPPTLRQRVAVSSSPSASTSLRTSSAPSRANASAPARPCPLLAPVTMHTLPSSRPAMAEHLLGKLPSPPAARHLGQDPHVGQPIEVKNSIDERVER